jgi:hypothetical protein
MTDELLAQVIAAAVGVVATVLWRLVDRFIPDQSHPLPPRPGVPQDPGSPPAA